MQFRDKVVVVTGSSGGIGRDIALEFARRGAAVVVNGRNETALDKVIDEIKGKGGTAIGVAADVGKKDEAKKLIQTASAGFGRIDILVNNAGGSRGSRYAEDLREEDWDQVLADNLKSVFLCSQAVIQIMKQQKYGRIINISSQAGRALSVLAGPHYASAKAGVIAFTRHLARELAGFGITVNALAPGLINSGPEFVQLWDSLPERERNKYIEDIPLRRLGVNQEVVSAVLFLASGGAGYFTGATLDVNGGRWMI